MHLGKCFSFGRCLHKTVTLLVASSLVESLEFEFLHAAPPSPY
jgi:hypothetical protein